MDDFDEDEFGGPLFGETAEQPSVPDGDEDASGSLSFGDDDTGSMPHWTEAPTGDIPRIDPPPSTPDPTDDLDVWSSFSGDAPVWKEGDDVDRPSGVVPSGAPADPTGELTWEDSEPADLAESGGEDEAAASAEPGPSVVPLGAEDDPVPPVTHDGDTGSGAVRVVGPAGGRDAGAVAAPREPGRITIGTDPSGMPRRTDQPTRRGGSSQRPSGGGATASTGGGRNLPVAIAVGLVLGAVFLLLTMWRPAGAIAFVTVALGVASIEYFSKVTEKGYRPVVAAGVAACVAAPLAAYWVGEEMYPIVLALCFAAGAITFIGASSIEVGPMPNMAITMLGVVWIGMLGSFAALIVRYSNFFGGDNSIGTDTLVLLGVGVVANDIGAYFAGRAFGQTPLRGWISPNKTVEGFLGGTILTLVVMLVVSIQDLSDTWSSTSHLLMLGIVISAVAPLGDLTESMFKRNLDVKDFGSVIRGHGGVLDRFDGFLFALPAVYYLMVVVEPWTVT